MTPHGNMGVVFMLVRAAASEAAFGRSCPFVCLLSLPNCDRLRRLQALAASLRRHVMKSDNDSSQKFPTEVIARCRGQVNVLPGAIDWTRLHLSPATTASRNAAMAELQEVSAAPSTCLGFDHRLAGLMVPACPPTAICTAKAQRNRCCIASGSRTVLVWSRAFRKLNQ